MLNYSFRANLPILNLIELKEIKNNPNREYLRKSIGNELALALQDAYKVRPENTIDYIANHLLNQNKSNNNLIELNNQFQKYAELVKEQEKLKEEQKQVDQIKAEQAKVITDKREAFLSDLDKSENIMNDLNIVSDHIKEYTSSTGVYFSKVSIKAKKCDESEHSYDVSSTTEKNVRFIAADADHQYMLKNEQPVDTVTGGLFEKKAEGETGAEANEEEGEGADKKKKAGKYFNDADADLGKQVIPEENKEDYESTFIPEVISNDKIIFYNVPKLGSMYLVKCNIRNYFDEQSIDTAISENKYYREKKKTQMEIREKHEEEMRAWEDSGNGDKPKPLKLEEIKKPDWFYTQHTICMTVDTLGQDRMLAYNEKKYAFNILNQVKSKYEAFQEKQIEVLMSVIDELDDKSFIRDFNALVKEKRDEVGETLSLPYGDEDKETFLKFESTRHALCDYRFYNSIIAMLRKCYVIKFSSAFVCLLYLFLNSKKSDLMEIDPIYGETNVCDWTKTRKFLNEDLRKKIENYKADECKEGMYPKYQKLKFIEDEMNNLNPQSMTDFCGTLNIIRDFILLTIKSRRIDRAYRLSKRDEIIKEIEKLKTEKEEFEKRKRDALEKNEEWTEGEFSKPIPDYPEEEIDNDFEEEVVEVKE
eukprot:Mrub_01412.p1 GENE.Mrub_01412~~Mrub_01412.p1  ORF type:complete len:647 (-),score=163.56 Mrub_01412:7-1947(-)